MPTTTTRYRLLGILLLVLLVFAANRTTGWPMTRDVRLGSWNHLHVGATKDEALSALAAADREGKISVVMMLDPKFGGWAAAPLQPSPLPHDREVLDSSSEWFFTEQDSQHEWYEMKFSENVLVNLTKRRRLWPFTLLAK
jgi:hypothetical protein